MAAILEDQSLSINDLYEHRHIKNPKSCTNMLANVIDQATMEFCQ